MEQSQNFIIQNLRTFAFFKSFPEHFLPELAAATESAQKPINAEILKQGQINLNLYFLVRGKVGVYVDGELVTYLSRPGELLGEMSVITSRPCSATIRTETEVEYYCIPTSAMDRLVDPFKGNIAHALYRTYSVILADRLSATNDKARRFEIANRSLQDTLLALEEANRDLEAKVQMRTKDLQEKSDELKRSHLTLETQNAELLASHRKMEELYFTKEATFGRLTSLYKDYLRPLSQSLTTLKSSVEPSAQLQMEIASREISGALQVLEPLTTLYHSEQAIRSKKVLLVESHKKQQVLAKMALGGTGVSLHIASNHQEATSALDKSTFDLIFVGPEWIEFAKMVNQRGYGDRLVFMTSLDIPSYLPVLRELDFIQNIVSRNEEDRTFTVKNIMTTVSKLVSHDLFGLEKYLIWGVDTKSIPVIRSHQRRSMTEAMVEHFKGIGMRSAVTDRCAIVAEEFLMNAIYDAPMRPDGTALYNHLGRQEEVQLKEHEQGEFRFACDGMLAALSVSDPFGGFRNSILFNYLDSCYGGRGGELNLNKGGAGRGLHLIIESSDLVVFNVQKGFKTEMIALFNLDSTKTDAGVRPSFHFFIS